MISQSHNLNINTTDFEHFSGKNLYGKYALDKTISGLLIVLLLPIFILSILGIFIEAIFSKESRGPTFISQERFSQGNKFKILKFRTYYINDDEVLQNIKDTTFFINDRRTTKVGKILRKYYIDEIPQLINILVGEMSFVGPRPWPSKQYYETIEKGYLGKKLLRGGLCGPIQATKGKEVRDRLRLDDVLLKEYMSRSSVSVIFLDVKIIYDCLRIVLRGEGL